MFHHVLENHPGLIRWSAYKYMHGIIITIIISVPAGSPSRGGDVAVLT